MPSSVMISNHDEDHGPVVVHAQYLDMDRRPVGDAEEVARVAAGGEVSLAVARNRPLLIYTDALFHGELAGGDATDATAHTVSIQSPAPNNSVILIQAQPLDPAGTGPVGGALLAVLDDGERYDGEIYRGRVLVIDEGVRGRSYATAPISNAAAAAEPPVPEVVAEPHEELIPVIGHEAA